MKKNKIHLMVDWDALEDARKNGDVIVTKEIIHNPDGTTGIRFTYTNKNNSRP